MSKTIIADPHGLHAYEDDEGEVYVATSADELVRTGVVDRLSRDVVLKELKPGTALSNDGEFCVGRCKNADDDDHSKHQCLDVDAALAAIAAGLGPDDSREGLIDQIWTYNA